MIIYQSLMPKTPFEASLFWMEPMGYGVKLFFIPGGTLLR